MTAVTGAAGIGLATLASDGSILDTWFPAPELTESGTSATSRLAVSDVPPELAALVGRDDDRDTETVAVRTVIGSLDDVAADAYDAYLRLHLLSHRLVAPHGLNAGGLFGVLTNVVWTNHGPCAVDGFEAVRARLRRQGTGDRLRRRQVPADGRLRRAHRRAHRRRRPGAARRAPGVGHHRDARGLRQLQRRHPGRVDGGGPHLGRRGGRRRLRHRRRSIDHGHAVRRWHPSHFDRQAVPARRQRGPGHLAGRRLRRRSRPVRHRGHQGQHARRQDGQGSRTVRRQQPVCSGAIR